MTRRAPILPVLLLSTAAAHAQAPAFRPASWALCTPDPLASLVTRDTGAPRSGPTVYTADTADSDPATARLAGNVVVERGDQRVAAPELVLDRNTNIGHAPQGADFGSPRLGLRAKRADVQLDDERAQFGDAQYYIPERNAQGSAVRVDDDRRKQRTDFDQVSYSTCERGYELWRLRAGRMELDHAAGRGEAWDVKIDIADVPVLYLPWMSFPIDDQRQSGFLAPSFGSGSETGLDIALPYYWNIAPDQDATFTPRIIAERGLMLGTEYRFLNPGSWGTLNAEVLPDDREAERDRAAASFIGGATWKPGLQSTLLYNWASDDDFFRDFGDSFDLADTAYLERRFDTVYASELGLLVTRFQGFQTLDGPDDLVRSQPYSRLPQLLYYKRWSGGTGPVFDLRGEAVNFDHPDMVKGARLDLEPAASLPLEWPFAFVTPRLAWRQTNYQLNYPGGTGGDPETDPGRGAPVFSVDGGLFFERPLAFAGREWIQTLEPRLYYLYVPYRDQNAIPIFDSAVINPSYPWMFYDNRFVGGDRLADANQLTTALSTRLIAAGDGREALRVSVGQIQYFEDRRVALGTDQLETSSHSDWITEGEVRVKGGWYVRAATQWDPDNRKTHSNALDLRYRPGDGTLLNLAYRYTKDPTLEDSPNDVDSLDVTGVWPINTTWRVFGRWNYSLLYEQTVDAFGGLEYGACCWAVRALARQYRELPQDEDTKSALYLEFELKGLSNLGTSVERRLRQDILGYDRTTN